MGRNHPREKIKRDQKGRSNIREGSDALTGVREAGKKKRRMSQG